MLIIVVLLFAGQFTGTVVSVHDGDTIQVLVDNGSWKNPVKVRLSEIDAPELKQPYGSRAKQALSARIFGKEVTVEDRGKDRYGRTIGTIYLGKEDINAWMVKDGWAWQYKQYSESKELAAQENSARQRQVGLWAGSEEPIPPWEWRREAAKNRSRRKVESNQTDR